MIGIRVDLCPYGWIDDELWVRETLRYRPEGWVYGADDSPVLVHPKDKTAMITWAHHKDLDYCVSIHMPRWASRIQLKITTVRVERIQDITEEEAKAEGAPDTIPTQLHLGIRPRMIGGAARVVTFRESFEYRWNELNKKRGYGWDVNPWVWVVEFERANP